MELWNEWEADLLDYLLRRTDDRAKINEVMADVRNALLKYPKKVESHFILFQSAHHRLGASGDWRDGVPLFNIGA